MCTIMYMYNLMLMDLLWLNAGPKGFFLFSIFENFYINRYFLGGRGEGGGRQG